MKKRTITVRQYNNEIKLSSLVPNKVKSARLFEDIQNELAYLNKKKGSTATLEHKALSITKILKRSLSEDQWGTVKHLLAPDQLTEEEVGKISDAELAKAIAQLSKELNPKDSEIDVKNLGPEDINVDAIKDPKKIDSTDDLVTDPSLVKKEGVNKSLNEKVLLREFGIGVTVLLAAPTIVKFLAKLIDWVAGYAGGDTESRAITRINRRILAVAKKTGEIPPKAELEKELGGFWKSVLKGSSYKDDAKYKDAAYEKIAKYVNKDGHGKFDPNATEPQEVSDHALHYLEDAAMNSQLGQWINKAAHLLHELYILPIKAVLFAATLIVSPFEVIGKRKEVWEYCGKVAEWIYTIGMLAVAAYGGIHAFDELVNTAPKVAQEVATHAPKLAQAFTLIVDAIKGGDMSAALITKLAASTFGG